MTNLRVALAPINAHVGGMAHNAALVLDACREAAAQQADLIVFPEMALTGYPVEDLALRSFFVAASQQAVATVAQQLLDEGLGELVVAVGYLDQLESRPANRVAVITNGTVVARYTKHHLPNYGVFDEFRYFRPGNDFPVVRVRGVDVAFAICEDLWQEGGPATAAAESGAGLLVVANASPYETDKDDVRGELVQRRAREAGCALAYVNLTGGQDELVFDGDCLVAAADGTLLARNAQFDSSVVVLDLDLPEATSTELNPPIGPSGLTVHRTIDLPISTPRPRPEPAAPPAIAPRLSTEAEVWQALTIGLRDYCTKNGIERVFLGLSGGIDSTVVAALAVDALGPDRVHGISNPSAWSTDHSKSDAADLAERTGLQFTTIPIAPMVDEFTSAMTITGVAEENLQARVRGVIWMAASNQLGPSIVLACSNKSELAVGYSTMYGDAVGGFAPIKDVYKTQVWELARWRNAEAERRGETPPIPPNTISKEPSAELRPGQKDTDSLPPYPVLDAILARYVGTDTPLDEMIADGFDRDLVLRVMSLTDRAEFKRRQFPPGTKISFKAFGRDRRLPLTNAFREG